MKFNHFAEAISKVIKTVQAVAKYRSLRTCRSEALIFAIFESPNSLNHAFHHTIDVSFRTYNQWA